MVDLFYKAGSQTDLVTIRGIATGCASYQLLLGELAVQSLGYRNGRIRSTGDTHCLIYIATAGQGITDGTAQTGGSTTERLDLCRMVVGLVLKIPATPRSLYGHRNPSPREPLRSRH